LVTQNNKTMLLTSVIFVTIALILVIVELCLSVFRMLSLSVFMSKDSQIIRAIVLIVSFVFTLLGFLFLGIDIYLKGL